MANTIWKYLLDVDDTNDIEMPIGAELLKVDMQHGSVCIWVKVDDSLEKEKRTFKIYGTGHLIDVNRKTHSITTIICEGDTIVIDNGDIDLTRVHNANEGF